MRNILLVILGLAIAAVAALFAFGVISLGPPEGDGDVVVVQGGAEEDPVEPLGDAPGLGPRTPEDQPPLEAFPLEEEVGVLLIVGVPEQFNATLAKFWNAQRKVRLISWAAPPQETPGSGPPSGNVLPGHWEGPLTAGTLDEKGIDVVVVHDLDPEHVPDVFWDALHEKVRAGRVGLLVIAGLVHGKAMLEHVGLRRMIPVKEARPIEGPELPGVYRKEVPFSLTEAGEKHPATRLVQWPSWSRRIWDSRRHGETPWGTPFCYPVVRLSEGATALVRVDPPVGETYPAIVEGPPEAGRVLWMGSRDLGPQVSHRDRQVIADWGVLVGNWIVWLAGKAP